MTSLKTSSQQKECNEASATYATNLLEPMALHLIEQTG